MPPMQTEELQLRFICGSKQESERCSHAPAGIEPRAVRSKLYLRYVVYEVLLLGTLSTRILRAALGGRMARHGA